jgi:hypothetical protein
LKEFDFHSLLYAGVLWICPEGPGAVQTRPI